MLAHVATETENFTVEDVATAAKGSVLNCNEDVVSVADVAA